MLQQLQVIAMPNADEMLFGQAWQLYEAAFPPMERREEELHRRLLAHPQFHTELFLHEQQLVALLFWWQFSGIRFVEHLAVDPQRRNQGIGQVVMKRFLTELQDLVVLEVDLPTDENSRRRIGFYERLGFKLNPFAYRQLPMREGGCAVEMLLLSFPRFLDISEFERYLGEFRTTCFDPYLKNDSPGK